jgi:hypothetical protein
MSKGSKTPFYETKTNGAETHPEANMGTHTPQTWTDSIAAAVKVQKIMNILLLLLLLLL